MLGYGAIRRRCPPSRLAPVCREAPPLGGVSKRALRGGHLWLASESLGALFENPFGILFPGTSSPKYSPNRSSYYSRNYIPIIALIIVIRIIIIPAIVVSL